MTNWFCGAATPLIDAPTVMLASTGFLPARGSLMLDLVVVAMLVVVVIMTFSIYLVRGKKQYAKHRVIQLALAITLAIAVVAFEIDIRFFTDWRVGASESPFYEGGWVDIALWIHLAFAIPTPFLWGIVIVAAIKNFRESKPGDHSKFHRFWGRLAALGMLMTAITGWVFYYLAFVAA